MPGFTAHLRKACAAGEQLPWAPGISGTVLKRLLNTCVESCHLRNNFFLAKLSHKTLASECSPRCEQPLAACRRCRTCEPDGKCGSLSDGYREAVLLFALQFLACKAKPSATWRWWWAGAQNAVPRHARPCRAMPGHAVPSRARLRPAVPCQAVPCCAYAQLLGPCLQRFRQLKKVAARSPARNTVLRLHGEPDASSKQSNDQALW